MQADDDAGRLKLRYQFLPSPETIHASPDWGNPNRVDLEVVLSTAPAAGPFALRGVRITIPVGENTPECLSGRPRLPWPRAAAGGPWRVTSSGRAIVVVPAGFSAELVGSVRFTLPGIQVNGQPGDVPITIEEAPVDGDVVVDGTTYRLTKDEPLPVGLFWAEPDALFDVGQTVTLYWSCADDGRHVFALGSDDGWKPKDCLGAGDCYTGENARAGVVTPPLTENTRFTLDVVAANPDGRREVVQRLATTVAVRLPTITDPKLTTYLSGRVVAMHWRACNAGSCSVLVDGVAVGERAPTNTSAQGYLHQLRGGRHLLAVVASSARSPARSAPCAFPEVDVPAAPVYLHKDAQAWAVAVTPDGKQVLVANNLPDGRVILVDLTSGTAKPILGSAARPAALAVTSDGSLALVACVYNVFAIDLRSYQSTHISLFEGQRPAGVAVTPDGALALVAYGDVGARVLVLDIAGRKLIEGIEIQGPPQSVAMTPDGTHALASCADGLAVIDLRARRQASFIALAGARPVAVTPDGRLALAASYEGKTVTVVDLASNEAGPPITVGGGPVSLAISSDGDLAVVANFQTNDVSIVSIASRRLVGKPIPVGRGPSGIAITPDNRAVVALWNGQAVIVL